MKLMFWKKSKNGKGKCCPKSNDCVERENLRTALKELRSYVDKIAQQQQKIEQLFNAINQAVYEIDQTIAIHEQVKEEAKRAEEWQKERLIRAIRQMKEEHCKKVEKLQNEKNKVESFFQSYKLIAEEAKKEKEEEVQKLKTEIHELQQKNKVLEEKTCQANESKYEPPLSEATALVIKKPVAVLPPLQSRRNIQAPQRIGGLNFNPLTSAFHVYNKEQSDFVKPASLSPLSPEDAEVAAILSNVAQPGEYVRQDYYGYY